MYSCVIFGRRGCIGHKMYEKLVGLKSLNLFYLKQLALDAVKDKSDLPVYASNYLPQKCQSYSTLKLLG